MPFHLPSISRREFLRRSFIAGAGLLTIPALRAADSKIDPDHWALFSDTHVAADATMVRFDVNMADHLRAAVGGSARACFAAGGGAREWRLRIQSRARGGLRDLHRIAQAAFGGRPAAASGARQSR
ncbi:MAG: hypothetical protein WDN28_29755 [Chthoniobacter sp.]